MLIWHTENVPEKWQVEVRTSKDTAWRNTGEVQSEVVSAPAGEPAPGPKLHPGRTIKAALVTAYGGPDKFSYDTVPEPIPGPGEILIKVAAAAINPVDTKLRNGSFDMFMPLEFPAQLGGDVSGTVEALGEGVTALRIVGRGDGAHASDHAIVVPAGASRLAPTRPAARASRRQGPAG